MFELSQAGRRWAGTRFLPGRRLAPRPQAFYLVAAHGMSRLLLVRHCEASGPRPDAPLTERGRSQASRLAAFLAAYPVDALVTSPFRRARETIAPFAATRGLAIAVDPRLAERRMSAEPDDAWRDTLRRSFEDPDYRLPGAESAREVVARGRAAVEDLLAGEPGWQAAVSHGQLMSLVLHAFDARFGFAGWESLSTPDVYLLDAEGDRVRFERVWRQGG